MPEAPHAVITPRVTLGLLAGGEGRRVGGADKGLLQFNGQSLIKLTLANAQNQLGKITTLISANRHINTYQALAPTVADQGGYSGPLAGVARLLEHCETEWLLTLPCDCPKLPPNFGDKLAQFLLTAESNQVAAVVNDGRRNQNAVLLVRRSQYAGLKAQLNSGHAAIHKWLATIAASPILFDDWPSKNWNANTVEDLQALIDD